MNHKLLTREEFGVAVSKRDGGRCVVCGRSDGQLDTHHILDRKLWDDGGYYLANGALLCAEHHLEAERTTLTCEALRKAAGIKEILIPEHLDQDEGEDYDKWGNQVMPTGMRIPGELFQDQGCQRMLVDAGLLSTFSKYQKYPRTMHLPWSPNLQNNDRRIKNLNGFVGEEVVVSIKRDGENTSLYSDHIHARSIDSKDHPSRSVIRALHGAFKRDIPDGWRICGENLYAAHSIVYNDLTSFFEVFGIWDENNFRLSWDEMTAFCSMLGVGIGPGFENGLPIVPVIYRGIWNEETIRALEVQLDTEQVEGYVVTVAGRIHSSEWRRKAAKFVRAKHVRTDSHWMRNWQPNTLTSQK